MTVMYFVRHGQSEGNVRGGFAGRVDYALSEKGVRQARCTADFLRAVHLDAVCASPLRRAQATAAPIAADRGLAVQTRAGLIEFDFGDWEGLALDTLNARFPDAVPTWKYHLPDVACPHGERMADCFARAKTEFAALARDYAGRDVCVVTHGAFLKCLFCALHGLPLAEIDRVPWADNASVTKVVIGADGVPAIEYENYSAHMGDLVTGVSRALTEKWAREGAPVPQNGNVQCARRTGGETCSRRLLAFSPKGSLRGEKHFLTSPPANAPPETVDFLYLLVGGAMV